MKMRHQFILNGRLIEIEVDPDRPLLHVLRVDLGLTGTKSGCGQAWCGACTVLVDGRAVRSCVYPAGDCAGKHVTTIEGLATEGRLHPVQASFAEHEALQCGYCTPGMILGAVSLLNRWPAITREEIRDHMDGHLCRCGSYGRIVEAIVDAAGRLGEVR